MKVATGRWGEFTIKKQAKGKNNFDKTRSFSILNTKYEYSIDQLYEIYTIVTDLTEKIKFNEFKKVLLDTRRTYGKT